MCFFFLGKWSIIWNALNFFEIVFFFLTIYIFFINWFFLNVKTVEFKQENIGN